MKKLLLLLAMLPAFSQTSFAQTYWLPGTPTGTIYYSGGNVGIGTASPTTTLDVNGPVKIEPRYSHQMPDCYYIMEITIIELDLILKVAL